jgi:AraC family transcriptional regulator
LSLMRENVARDLDMETVARKSGLSRAHFFSMFRDELELTPAIFWNSLRLEKAMLQMRSSQESLTSVASTLGFSAQCNFTRFFRQRTGVAPSDYRRALRRKRRSRSTPTILDAPPLPSPDTPREQDLELAARS